MWYSGKSIFSMHALMTLTSYAVLSSFLRSLFSSYEFLSNMGLKVSQSSKFPLSSIILSSCRLYSNVYEKDSQNHHGLHAISSTTFQYPMAASVFLLVISCFSWLGANIFFPLDSFLFLVSPYPTWKLSELLLASPRIFFPCNCTGTYFCPSVFCFRKYEGYNNAHHS